jgi:hypothetical protein
VFFLPPPASRCFYEEQQGDGWMKQETNAKALLAVLKETAMVDGGSELWS